MSKQDLIALLYRGSAAIETPDDLTRHEREHVAQDLAQAANDLTDLWADTDRGDIPRT